MKVFEIVGFQVCLRNNGGDPIVKVNAITFTTYVWILTEFFCEWKILLSKGTLNVAKMI